jgi:hypothetical protein
MKKTKEVILRIWKDPVWSKVISAAIIFLVATIWAKYNHYSLSDIYNFSLNVLTFELPIYFFASLIGLFFIIRYSIKFFKNRKDPIWDEQIGNYTFGELYSILQRQNLPVGTVGMGWSGQKPPDDDLLTLFHRYSSFLSKGITLEDQLDDGGYLYGVLSPKLVGYGIVEKIETKNLQLDLMDIKYQTSELGHKFFALLEKVIHLKKNV